MNTPLISVIIPAYNVERYIDKCLKSVCAQTYGNLEIILVNDGSTDNTPKLCDRWAEKDNRIRVIHKKNKEGVSDARNAGLKNASGRYIGFVDSDDWIDSEMFQCLFSLLQNSNSSISVCGIIRETENGEHIKSIRLNRNKTILSANTALKYLLMDKSENSYLFNKLFKKELFDGIEFPAQRIFEDMAVLHLLYAEAGFISYTGKKLYHYVRRPNSLVVQKNVRKEIDFFLASKERYRFILNHKGFSNSERKALMLRTEQRLMRTAKKINKITDRNAFLSEKQIIKQTVEEMFCANYNEKKTFLYLLRNYLQSIPYLYLYR